jgi:nicotinamide-nucleotide amidase
MKPMFDNYVMADLEKMSRGIRISSMVLKVTGLGESAMDDLIAPIYRQYSNPSTTVLFTDSDLEIHLTAKAETAERAEALAGELAEKLADKLGNYLYSANGESMEEVVGQRLALKRYTLATAESCTGGLIAERITRVPGSSDYFLGGVVSYAEVAKAALLGVSRELIEKRGVVSGDVAEAMARGVKERFGATIGLGITGIAGPTGGTDETPVGTVYVGIADDVGASNRRMILPGDRHLIRWRASQAALEMVRRRYLL